jgi:glycosyltransferase involved in cell wall biosynthesis
MIVGNDVTVDQRVKKIALTVALAGPKVTVIGLSTTGERWETHLGPVHIIRVPVKFTRRDWARAGVSKRSAMSPGLNAKQKYVAARTRRKLEQREIQAAIGRLKTNPTLIRRGRAEWLRWKNRLVGKWYRLWEILYQRRLAAAQAAKQTVSQRIAEWIPGLGSTSWRRALPELHDYELAFGPVIDDLEPDVIHAHDVHMIGIAERAVARARFRGRSVMWIYDAHEYVQGLARYTRRIVAAWTNLEDEYIRGADRVITVSAPLAELLVRDYHLSRFPDLVLNIPIIRTDQHDAITIREAIGLPDETPLVVYSGGVDATRGVHTLVEAVGRVPGVHLGLVVKARTNYVLSLLEAASRGGFEDRIHIVGFVDPDKVVPFLSGATIAVHPMVSNKMNHQIALPNKIFEYLNARLPVIVSDNKAMSDLVTENGVGEVFVAEDSEDLAVALRRVLADPTSYREAIETSGVLKRYTWQAQADVLLDVYADILGPKTVTVPAATLTNLDETDTVRDSATALRSRTSSTSLLIGPRNSAGQAAAWAGALESRGVSATSLALVRPGPVAFPADLQVQPAEFRQLEWQLSQSRRVATGFTHVLSEGGTSVIGRMNGGFATDDAPFLAEHGVRLGILMHGSEIRRPSTHRRLLLHSPFHVRDELTSKLEHATASLEKELAGFDGKLFVTTPDLLEYVPQAEWLPVVVDLEVWHPGPTRSDDGPFIVAHIPSSERLKGTEHVDAVCKKLEEEGAIEYVRLTGIAPDDVPRHIRSAHVVVDGIVLGAYGLMSVQAMASGAIAVADVSLVGNLNTPIVSAQPETLRRILLELRDDRARLSQRREAGLAFVDRYHSGAYAADRLIEFLETS